MEIKVINYIRRKIFFMRRELVGKYGLEFKIQNKTLNDWIFEEYEIRRKSGQPVSGREK